MRAPFKNTDWSGVAEALDRAAGIVVITHKNPDSDGIGSQIALFHALNTMGKRVWMHNLDPVPRICRYLDGSNRATSGNEFKHLREVDTVISVDCGAISRLGMPEGFFAGKTVINIDHHASNRNFGQVNVVDASYCATGAMIYDLFSFLGIALTPAMAAPLYVALMTDTSSFRLSTVNADVFRLAAELVEAGADPAAASKAVYGSNSVARLELLKLSFGTLELHDKQRSAWLHVTDAMYQQTNADTEDTEGFIDYGRGIEGVDITIFIRPGSEGCWKLSFRGANGFDVGSLASELGGGGHRYAAGCDLRGTLDEVKERVHPLVTRLLSN
ncbi:MAG: bifunctional oligoribonuclease/PAP phosphatase NrnA [Mariprofundaceae bacterium]|nr:bifunctional oligoribonuclease/PAP phosphatase NrnA [Mariprofundaceae bacterium]